MTDLYRSCDLDTLINYWAKQSLFKMMDHNPKAVKDSIVTRAAQILATYRYVNLCQYVIEYPRPNRYVL